MVFSRYVFEFDIKLRAIVRLVFCVHLTEYTIVYGEGVNSKTLVQSINRLALLLFGVNILL